MEKPPQKPRSYLFTIRVWQEEIHTGQIEWRGKVQLLTSGEVCYFRNWETLVPLLLKQLVESDAESDR